MTHFFYRQKRQLVRESPLLPLIKDVEAKERERKLLLLHDPTHHSLLDSSTQSQIVKLPHELEENYKEIHERRLYKRIFQNYEGQYEENKRWDVHKIRDFMKRMFAKKLGRLEQRYVS